MRFLVWSNEHRAWWRAVQAGYTGYIEEAGRYGRAEAQAIVAKATLDGELFAQRRDPVTRVVYRQCSEVLVLAPEDIPDGGAQADPCASGCSNPAAHAAAKQPNTPGGAA